MPSVLSRGGHVVRAAIKFFKVIFLIVLFFLLQTTVMPHLKINGVMPNLLMVIIAIMTVSYGKLYAFISGAMVGVILEAMSYSIPLFYLLIYPVLALLCAQVFADMSDIKREIRRIRQAQRQSEAAAELKAPFIKKKIRIRIRRDSPYDLNAHLRILLNSLMLVALYEGVMLIYIALSGIDISFNHFLRIFYTLVYTAACCIVMFPVRSFLGLYKRRRKASKMIQEQELETDRDLLRQLAMVPDEAPVQKKPVFQFLKKKPREEKPSEKTQAQPVPEPDDPKEEANEE
ncbi:MAG: hypothetical protein QM308_09830 [Bacillota bacterium]|nr:hypothetical protein [Bacillota bacterium]